MFVGHGKITNPSLENMNAPKLPKNQDSGAENRSETH
jgi:hypothetical protein